MMNISLRRTQRGVSLIELMLALAIIAIILVIATRYFARANLSQQVSNATDQVMGVRAAANSYLNDKPGVTSVTIKDLITNGYLPQSYAGSGTGTSDAGGTGVNPWNGNISITLANGKYSIVTTGVPEAACPTLRDKLLGNTNSGLGETVSECANTDVSTLTATFTR